MYLYAYAGKPYLDLYITSRLNCVCVVEYFFHEMLHIHYQSIFVVVISQQNSSFIRGNRPTPPSIAHGLLDPQMGGGCNA